MPEAMRGADIVLLYPGGIYATAALRDAAMSERPPLHDEDHPPPYRIGRMPEGVTVGEWLERQEKVREEQEARRG